MKVTSIVCGNKPADATKSNHCYERTSFWSETGLS